MRLALRSAGPANDATAPRLAWAGPQWKDALPAVVAPAAQPAGMGECVRSRDASRRCLRRHVYRRRRLPARLVGRMAWGRLRFPRGARELPGAMCAVSTLRFHFVELAGGRLLLVCTVRSAPAAREGLPNGGRPVECGAGGARPQDAAWPCVCAARVRGDRNGSELQLCAATRQRWWSQPSRPRVSTPAAMLATHTTSARADNHWYAAAVANELWTRLPSDAPRCGCCGSCTAACGLAAGARLSPSRQ